MISSHSTLFRGIFQNHLYVDVIGTEQHYFGLQFMDVHNVPQWIEEDKEVRKQVKIGPPYTLHFRVRFYPSEPDLQLKEELTRYQVFLQLKQDLCVPTVRVF